MSVKIKGYCYNSTGQLCITIAHEYAVAAAAVPVKHTIVVTINGVDHTFEVEGTDEFTFCQNETTGPITVSDDGGGGDEMDVDPPDATNKCATDA